MGIDVFTRGARVMSRRWRMRLVLAALVVDVVMWGHLPTLYLAAGGLVLLIMFLVLGRRSRPLLTPPQVPPWVPPWQARASRIDRRRLRTRRPCRNLWAVGLWSALGMEIRWWARAVAAAGAALLTVPAQLREHAAHVSDVFAALPSRLSRPAPRTEAARTDAIAALTALLDRTLAELGIAGQVAPANRPRVVSRCVSRHTSSA